MKISLLVSLCDLNGISLAETYRLMRQFLIKAMMALTAGKYMGFRLQLII